MVAVAVVAAAGVAVWLMRGHRESADDKYLTALKSNGLAGQFPSDANAIAAAKKTCRDLENGGPPHGMPVDKIAVDIYCPQFSQGFHVLQTVTVTGTFTLRDSDPSTYYPSITTSGSSCWGTRGYSDIGAGTPVVVKNGKGEVLTTTELGTGTGTSSSCVFTFTFKATEGQDRYMITVSHRGDISFSFDQLKDNDVALTLGQ